MAAAGVRLRSGRCGYVAARVAVERNLLQAERRQLLLYRHAAGE